MNTVSGIFGDEKKQVYAQMLASILCKVKTVVKGRRQWGRKADSR